MKNGMMVSHLWRTGKRAVAVALIALFVGILAAPQTGLTAPEWVHADLPADGLGDSPLVP
jgi:hypothetical protein